MGTGADLQYTLGLDGTDFAKTTTASTKAAQGLSSMLAGLGAAAFGVSLIKRGLDFNQTMYDGEKAVAAIIQQFQGLDAAAANTAATKAMRQLVELEPKVAGSLSDIVKGFVATAAVSAGVGITVEQNIDLVGRFANALAKMNLPIEQVGQELRSILTGNITQDSTIAKALSIDNATVEKLRTTGKLYDYLVANIGRLGAAGDNAATSFSSLESAVDQVAGAFTKELFGEAITSAKDLTDKLNESREGFLEFGAAVGRVAREVGKFSSFVYEATQQAGRLAAISVLMVKEGMSYADAVKIADEAAAVRKRDTEAAAAEAAEIKKVGEAAMEAAEQKTRSAKLAAEATAKAGLTRNPEQDAKRKKKKEEDAAWSPDKAAKALDEVLDKQEALDELKRQSAMDEMTTAQKVAAIREQITEAAAREAALKSDPFSQDQGKLLDAEKQRVELQRELNALQKQQTKENDEAAKKAQDKAESARKERAEKDAARNAAAGELAILREQAAGHDKKAEALAKELRLEQDKQEIMKKQGATEEDALRQAREKMSLEDRIAKRQDKSHAGEVGSDGRVGGKHIGGVGKSHGLSDNSGPLANGGLAEYKRLQEKHSIGKSGVMGHTFFDPLSNRSPRAPGSGSAGMLGTASQIGKLMGKTNVQPLSSRIAAVTSPKDTTKKANPEAQADPVLGKLEAMLSELVRIRTA